MINILLLDNVTKVIDYIDGSGKLYLRPGNNYLKESEWDRISENKYFIELCNKNVIKVKWNG